MDSRRVIGLVPRWADPSYWKLHDDTHDRQVDAREWLERAREAACKVCKQRYLEFGCEGRAAKVQPMTLSEAVGACRSGKRAQTVV